MRTLLIVMALALAFGAPVAAAEEGATTSTSTGTEPPATGSSSGPEPTSCRPYCLSD